VTNPYGLRAPGSANVDDVVAAIRANWPGPDYGDDELKPREHPIYQAYRGWYQLYGNLYAGGRRVHRPPPGTVHPISGEQIDSYLERHEKETDEEYAKRRRTAFTLPYPKDIVRIFTSTMFRQEVDRSPIRETIGEDILADVDLLGHSVREYLRRGFALAHVYGWVANITDEPRLGTTDRPPTALEARESGHRPYSRIVTPLQYPYWEQDTLTGEFLVSLIREAPNRWRWWTPAGWIDVDRAGAVLDAGEHDFGRVPIDLLVCEAPDDEVDQPFGISALSDVALIALHIYQMCSLLEDHERRALFAFLHIERPPPVERKGGEQAKAPDLHVGGSHYIWVPGPVSWVEPPDSVPKEAREQILWAIEEMRQASGVGIGSERSLEQRSAVALQWEYSSRHNAVYERAQNLEDFESRLWQTYGERLGIAVPMDAVRYPRDYAVRSIEQELADLTAIFALFGGWASVPEEMMPMVQVKLRRIAVEDVGHLPEIQAILDGIAALEAPDEPVAVEAVEATDGDAEPEPVKQDDPEAVDPQTALNGAQVTALLEVVQSVVEGQLPRESAIAIIVAAFPVDQATADAMLGTVGTTFVPEPTAPPPQFGAPPEADDGD